MLNIVSNQGLKLKPNIIPHHFSPTRMGKNKGWQYQKLARMWSSQNPHAVLTAVNTGYPSQKKHGLKMKPASQRVLVPGLEPQRFFPYPGYQCFVKQVSVPIHLQLLTLNEKFSLLMLSSLSFFKWLLLSQSCLRNLCTPPDHEVIFFFIFSSRSLMVL